MDDIYLNISGKHPNAFLVLFLLFCEKAKKAIYENVFKSISEGKIILLFLLFYKKAWKSTEKHLDIFLMLCSNYQSTYFLIYKKNQANNAA